MGLSFYVYGGVIFLIGIIFYMVYRAGKHNERAKRLEQELDDAKDSGKLQNDINQLDDDTIDKLV